MLAGHNRKFLQAPKFKAPPCVYCTKKFRGQCRILVTAEGRFHDACFAKKRKAELKVSSTSEQE